MAGTSATPSKLWAKPFRVFAPTCRKETLFEKAVIKIRAKVTRTKHLKVHACDVTPPPLSCRMVSDVVEVEGLDVAQETMKIDP